MSEYISETFTSNDWLPGKHIISQSDQLSFEQLLQLMNQINGSVKAGLFNTQLASQIFKLCQQLKLSGQLLEHSNKNELNKVFISLRQACCRDNGQLGTPCRLKMMEIVELRAMGWRPSLAHTQYYLSRPEQSQHTEPGKISAPPFGAIPLAPFGRFAPSQPIFFNSDVAAPQVVSPPPPPTSFYLIPAAGGWLRPMIANQGLLTQENFLQQAPPVDLEAWARANKILPMKVKPKPSQPKTPQIRDELVIRNSDSGKIMGVKGRRVAVVEELSNTVISFQKVDPKNKDRTLTITGSTQEAIEYAKRLIEQTIRRNISPTRLSQCPTSEEQSHGRDIMCKSDICLPIKNACILDSDDETTELEEADNEDIGISIETTQDGMLKLSCADPQVLQAAQEALSSYLTKVGRSHRMSAEEKEERKERRKSMPLSSSAPFNNPKNKWRSSGKMGSTPNLAAASRAIIRYNRLQMNEIKRKSTAVDTMILHTIKELCIARA